jgi:FixJ family two-component response regulator
MALDHDRGECETLRIPLENAGYKVVCVADEVALLNAVKQKTPACIVIDVTLRGVAGLSILAHLRDYGAPVIVTSENGDISTAVKAIKAGAQSRLVPRKSSMILRKLEKFSRSRLA